MDEILSIVVSIFSIFLGICAIVQAKRYNQESDKLNADTKKMLSLQLEEIQTIERKITRYLIKTDENIIEPLGVRPHEIPIKKIKWD